MSKAIIYLLIFILNLSLNIYGKNYNKLINEFDKNAKPHFKRNGCLVDTLKYLKRKNYRPYIYIENTPNGYELYCNSFWITEDRNNKKYYIIRALVDKFRNFKEYQKNIKAKFIIKNHYKSNKYGTWWIYQKEIKEIDFKVVKKQLNKIKKIDYCEDEVMYKGSYSRIGKYMFLQGRIVIGYPKIKKIDYKRSPLGVLDKKCEGIKELGEFIIYLFDENKNINQGTPTFMVYPPIYKNRLIYEKIDRDNKKLNQDIVKYLKKGLLKFLNFYKEYFVSHK